MKKILSPLLLIITVIYSCQSPNPHILRTDTTHITDTAATTRPGGGPHYSSPQLLAYDQWLTTLDTQKVGNSLLAMQRFQQLFAKQSAAICDTAFYLFNIFHTRQADFLSTNPNTNDSLTLAHNGIRTYEEEGLPQLAKDWAFLDRYFSPYVSAEMKEFLSQESKEDKEGFQDDAALTIAPEHLVDRAVWWEQFAHKHPAFLYTQDARDQHAFYLRILLTGMDNTPIQSEGKLTEYYKNAYTFAQKSYGQTETNAVLAPYFTALKTGDTATVSRIQEKYAPPHP
ncbi:MAG: hypothetical protein JST68_12480 [Bacteroidetes bacterium]|nr:hypothetical protein [Bacteroidota bacterium]